ncbi:AKAP7 2'5' RNA ligase-like domain-containing protein [Zychaea mexicana]|uniref:AKAP7 2'5' RNA ligase-like domain-containing protein n=1 Tax=Zychaea mexicana TaxID=64656 RepID=UPI0022FDC792|nr:AKAP7 2'5' RNA ligase-like domain-containing protein [Zychaea mexicana]KAI9490925.1 AKAP7 2'5' RNA ligase-like domain-containing protein [Zychaea mexicana]
MASSSSSSRQRIVKSMQGISLVKVQGRTYRVPTSSLDNNRQQSVGLETKNLDLPSSASSSDEEEGGTIYTEEILTIHHPVHPKFHGILIGKGGSTLKKLRIETGTRIDITKGKDYALIKGTQEKIDKATQAIEQVIQQAYDKARLTHFLSLPVTTAYTTRKLEEFHSSILSSTFKCDGMDPSILVLPANLHITLGVFKLLHQTEIERAVRFLKEECPKIVREAMADQDRALSVRLRNLAIMQSNPTQAHVLYIEPNEDKEDTPLKKLCQTLIDKMVQAGLMVPDDRPLKTHVTLINTANRSTSDESGSNNKRRPFDARPILKEYPHLDLGLVQLDKLHLMKMGRRGPGKTYISEGSISIEP